MSASRFIEDKEQIRAGVSCAVVLEKHRDPWRLDVRESTRACLKYRRGAEVLLVNHDGRGWWDPTRPADDRTARGDVFALAQHLNPGLDFGHARKLLRALIGLRPTLDPAVTRRAAKDPGRPAQQRWDARRRPRPGTPTWRFLTLDRKLPPFIVERAIADGLLREGCYGSGWFAYRDHAGRLTGFEMHGRGFHGFTQGAGAKSLFRLRGGPGPLARLAACEGAIDALSLAAIEGVRADTLYLATTGGMGPNTLAGLRALLQEAAMLPGAVLVAATDNDRAGALHAEHLAALARAAGVAYERSLPSHGRKDWNDVVRFGAQP